MMMAIRSSLLLGLFLGIATIAPEASSQTASAKLKGNCKQSLVELGKGYTAYEAHQYEEAAQYLARSMSLQASPTAGYYLGRSYEALGKLSEAAAAYREALGSESLCADDDDVRRSEQELKQKTTGYLHTVEARLPQMTVNLVKAGSAAATVLLDNEPLAPEALGKPIEVNPGAHSLTARCAKSERQTDVSLAEGDRKTLPLALDCPKHAGLKVRLHQSGAGRLALRLDGEPIPLPSPDGLVEVASGRHELLTLCDDREVSRTPVLSLAEGETREVEVDVRCPSPTVSGRASDVARAARASGDPRIAGQEPGTTRGLPVLFWVGAATGVAGAVLWGVTGALALDKRASLLDECGGSRCPPEKQGDADSLDRLRYLSTGGAIVGVLGAGLAGGVWVFGREPEPRAGLSLELGPGAARISGSF